jgi:hypothetical protein
MPVDKEPQVKQEKEPELKRPEKQIKDLEPDKEEGKDVKGGYFKYGG